MSWQLILIADINLMRYRTLVGYHLCHHIIFTQDISLSILLKCPNQIHFLPILQQERHYSRHLVEVHLPSLNAASQSITALTLHRMPVRLACDGRASRSIQTQDVTSSPLTLAYPLVWCRHARSITAGLTSRHPSDATIEGYFAHHTNEILEDNDALKDAAPFLLSNNF